MKKGDLAVIAFLIILALVVWGFNSLSAESSESGLFAVIYKDGEEYKRIDLDKNRENFNIDLGNVLLEISEGKIRFAKSECENHYCVNAGWLKNAGDTAICLPLKVAVVITGEGHVDGIAG